MLDVFDDTLLTEMILHKVRLNEGLGGTCKMLSAASEDSPMWREFCST